VSPAAAPSGGRQRLANLAGAVRDWARRLVWPEAPRPVTHPLAKHELLQAWLRTMFYAGAGAPGTCLDDMLWQARLEQTLNGILEEYREGRAQTPFEMTLAESLEYVAQTYGGRRP